MHQGIVLDPQDVKTLLRGGRLTIRGVPAGDLDIWATAQATARMPRAVPSNNGHVLAAAGRYRCTCGGGFATIAERTMHLHTMRTQRQPGHKIVKRHKNASRNERRASSPGGPPGGLTVSGEPRQRARPTGGPWRCLCGETFIAPQSFGAHLRYSKPKNKHHLVRDEKKKKAAATETTSA